MEGDRYEEKDMDLGQYDRSLRGYIWTAAQRVWRKRKDNTDDAGDDRIQNKGRWKR